MSYYYDMDLSRRFYSITIAIFILAVLLALYLSKDFLLTLLVSVFIAFILFPIYDRLIQFTGQRQVSSALSLVIVFVLLIVVILIIVVTFLNEISGLLDSGESIIKQVAIISDEFTTSAYRYLPSSVADYVGQLPPKIVDWALLTLSDLVSYIVGNIPILFTHFVLILFFTYYILVDGRRLFNRAVDRLPEKIVLKRFISHLDDIYTSLFHVFLITAGATAVLAAIGFFILGVPYPLLFGLLVGLLEIIPFLGSSAIVWPMVIYYALAGDLRMAGALMILAILLSVIPEEGIRPRLAQKSARIHPVITVLAFTGPLFVLGIYGVILGPAVFGFVLAGYRTLSRIWEL